MIVVALVGVLSTLAIQGVRKYILNAKQAEMRSTLGSLAKAGVIAYETEKVLTSTPAPTGALVASGAKTFCGNSTLVPSIDRVRGTKYLKDPLIVI